MMILSRSKVTSADIFGNNERNNIFGIHWDIFGNNIGNNPSETERSGALQWLVALTNSKEMWSWHCSFCLFGVQATSILNNILLVCVGLYDSHDTQCSPNANFACLQSRRVEKLQPLGTRQRTKSRWHIFWADWHDESETFEAWSSFPII